MLDQRFIAIAAAILLLIQPLRAADFFVTNSAALSTALSAVNPGDTITMADGTWTNQTINFSRSGNSTSGITLRAQTPGRVILTGSSKITISGDYLTTTGLAFKDGSLTGGQIASITSSASFSRLTNCAFIDYEPRDATGAVDRTVDYEWVRVDGVQNRVDHNFFKGHNHPGITLEVFPSAGSKHQIDNNHFVDRPHGTGNGWETIRIGLSSVQTRSAQTLVENNLFERVDGELEIISNKTSDNIIRNNTIRASDGTITLRHGQGSRVEGNFILGENKAGSGGIRVIGPNHVVVNNYMQDLDTNALSITTGYSDWDVATTATGYEPVNNVLIAHNTIVNVTDQIVTRDAGYTSDPTSTRNLRPANVTMANNIFQSTSETLIQGTEGTGWTWAGNIGWGATVGKSGTGMLNVNPLLVKDANGLWRPAANSPAINAAAAPGVWPQVADDMDGQLRAAPRDIGADEVNGSGATTHKPLYGGDVGPGWLKRRSKISGIAQPVLIVEAEDFTSLLDPNGNGQTWNVVSSPTASGGKYLKAPAGTRTDVPAQTHDAVVEFDFAFHDIGTYFFYGLVRADNDASNSLYTPLNLGDTPTVNETLPFNGQWSWVELASYSITADQINRPLTLSIGRREGGAEIDTLLLSPVQLTTVVPEPAMTFAIIAGLLVPTRRVGRRRICIVR